MSTALETPEAMTARMLAEAKADIAAGRLRAAAPAPAPAPDPLEAATDPGQLAQLRAAVVELDAQRRRAEAEHQAAVEEAREYGEDAPLPDIADQAARLRVVHDLKATALAEAEAKLEAALATKRPQVPNLDAERRSELRAKASRLGDHRLGELVHRMVMDRDLGGLAAIRDMIPPRHQGTVGRMLEAPQLTAAESERVERFRGHLHATTDAVVGLQRRTLATADRAAVKAADLGPVRGRDMTSAERLAFARKHGSQALMSLPW